MEKSDRKTPPEELRRQASIRLAQVKAAGLDGQVGEVARFMAYAAGFEMEAFATYPRQDFKNRRKSGMAAFRLFSEISDHQHVVTFGTLMLEILDGNLSRDAKREIKTGIKKSRAQLPQSPIPPVQNI